MGIQPYAELMHKVGFVVEGTSNLKVFGSLLREAKKHQVEPVLFIASTGGGKDYDIVQPQVVVRTFPDVDLKNIHTYGEVGITQLAQQTGVKAVLLINAYKKYESDVQELKVAGIASYGLDYFVNALYTAATAGFEATAQNCVAGLTGRLVISDYWRDLEFTVRPELKNYADKFISGGNPVIDTFKYIDKDTVREQLGIASGQKYLTFMTPNIRKKHTYLMYGLRTVTKLKKALAAWQNVCHDHGLAFVIKSRAKQWDTPLYRKYADYFLDDIPSVVYPYTSALLLSESEMLVHFGSLSVIEAAAVGVPSVGISVAAINKLHGYMNPTARKFLADEMLQQKNDALFNFSGVSEQVLITASAATVQQVFDSLQQSRSNQNRYQQFNQKFNGQTDYEAASRIYQHILH